MSKRRNGKGNKASFRGRKLSPQQAAVITALLLDALKVDSVLVDKDQTVQIVLQGSLRKKTRMDEIMDEMSEMTLGDLLDSLMKR